MCEPLAGLATMARKLQPAVAGAGESSTPAAWPPVRSRSPPAGARPRRGAPTPASIGRLARSRVDAADIDITAEAVRAYRDALEQAGRSPANRRPRPPEPRRPARRRRPLARAGNALARRTFQEIEKRAVEELLEAAVFADAATSDCLSGTCSRSPRPPPLVAVRHARRSTDGRPRWRTGWRRSSTELAGGGKDGRADLLMPSAALDAIARGAQLGHGVPNRSATACMGGDRRRKS